MPMAAGAAAAVAISGAISGVAISTIAINVAITFALSVVSQALAPKPKSGDSDRQDVGNKVLIRSTISPHQVIYGKTVVAGTLVFAEATGTGNKFLHLVIVYAAHEVESFDTLHIDDKSVNIATGLDGNGVVTSGTYTGKLRARFYNGTQAQTADSLLISETAGKWTAAHTGTGRAYAYFRLEFDNDVYQSGVPEFRLAIKGRKVWDPRNDPGDPSVRAWSDNAKLCQLDFIMSNFGYNIPIEEIHEASWVAAANVCDETVDSMTRYTINGFFYINTTPNKIMEELLSADIGTIIYQQGAFRGYTAAATTASDHIDISDLRGNIQITSRPGRDGLFNTIRGIYIDSANLYSPTDFAKITDPLYVSEDNDEELIEDIELNYTINSRRASRIARLTLDSHRQGLTARIPLKLSKLGIAAWDTITVTIADLGWNMKKFRVLTWAFEGVGIELTVQEEADAIYTFDPDTVQDRDPAPDTNLPNPFVVAPPTNLMVQCGDAQLVTKSDGTVISRIKIIWTDSTDIFVRAYEAQYKKSSESVWVDLAPIAPGIGVAYVSEVTDSITYDVRVRAVNILQKRSTWLNFNNHFVIGKTARPPNVDTFNVSRLADGTRRFTWSAVTIPADVRSGGGFEIRSKVGTGHAWDDLVPMFTQGLLQTSPIETNELAAGTYTFGIKMVDSSGNESTTANIIEATLGDPRLRNVVEQRIEFDLGWPGTLNNCFVNYAGIVEAISSQDWDDLPSTWDSLNNAWSGILASVSPIDYTTPEIDLGVDLTFTPLVTVDAVGTPTVTMQTGTDADGSATGSFVSLNTVTARYIKLNVSVADTSPRINNIVTLLDGDVGTEDFEDIDTSASSAGNFERIAQGHFKLETDGEISVIINAKIVAFQNAGSGWTWELLSKATTITGGSNPAAEFKIYKDGTLTDATIDAEIKGYKS